MYILKIRSNSEQKKVVHFLCLIFLAVGFSTNAQADTGKGDWLMRTGYTFLLPQLGNESLIEIEKYSMPTISFSYLMTDNLAIEFLAGVPSSIDINERVTGFNTKMAAFTPIAPNATLQYYFNNKDRKFRPYIGAGLLFSTFHSEQTHGILQGASINIEDSLDPLTQIGFDYAINERFALNLDVRKLYTSTTAITTDLDQTIMGINAPLQMDYAMGTKPVTVSLNFVLFFDIPEKTERRQNKDREILERIKQRRQNIKLIRRL